MQTIVGVVGEMMSRDQSEPGEHGLQRHLSKKELPLARSLAA